MSYYVFLTVFLQELNINNTQYAILQSSENFIKATLILPSGVLTDRYGGASMLTQLHNAATLY